MYNNLYNTPIAIGMTTPWFHGCDQAACMGRSCIVTSTGVLYVAISVGEDRIKVMKSFDNGFTWEFMKLFELLYQSEGNDGAGGVGLYLDYSEIDDILYVIYIAGVVGGDFAGNQCPYVYDVTNDVGIGFVSEGWLDCLNGRFAVAGHVDRKLIITWAHLDDLNKLYAILVDVHHYEDGIHTMTLAPLNGVVQTGMVIEDLPGDVGLFDVSEVDDGFWLWWVAEVDGELYAKKIGMNDDQEDIGSDANINPYNPPADTEIIELFGCEDSVLFTTLHTTPANSRLRYYSVTHGAVEEIAFKNGASALAEAPGGAHNYYAWPQLVALSDGGVDKMQAFFMGRNAGDTYNELETCGIVVSTGVEDTVKVVTGSLASPWSLRNKCYCIFEPPNRTKIELNSRGGLLVAIGNGTPEGFGHRSGNCTVYIEWLYNNAYPLTITSTYISASPADYHSSGDLSQHEKQANMVFEKRGIPLLILKYELNADPQIRHVTSYIAPVEIELKGFINELSLKNPTNITLDATEEYANVLEKDIRQLYFPAERYLDRTYKRVRRGFVMRTVYLLKFYGRFYEITQVVPVFGKYGIICNKANLYVCGASYDPFTRKVLPNET